jgi:hypothetical protein
MQVTGYWGLQSKEIVAVTPFDSRVIIGCGSLSVPPETISISSIDRTRIWFASMLPSQAEAIVHRGRLPLSQSFIGCSNGSKNLQALNRQPTRRIST